MNKREFLKAYTNADSEQERQMILEKYQREQKPRSVYIIGGDGSSVMNDLVNHPTLKKGKDWDIIENKLHIYF